MYIYIYIYVFLISAILKEVMGSASADIIVGKVWTIYIYSYIIIGKVWTISTLMLVRYCS